MLTDRTIQAAKPKDKTYRLADGNDLHLEVSPSGVFAILISFRRALPTKSGQFSLRSNTLPSIRNSEAQTLPLTMPHRRLVLNRTELCHASGWPHLNRKFPMVAR